MLIYKHVQLSVEFITYWPYAMWLLDGFSDHCSQKIELIFSREGKQPEELNEPIDVDEPPAPHLQCHQAGAVPIGWADLKQVMLSFKPHPHVQHAVLTNRVTVQLAGDCATSESCLASIDHKQPHNKDKEKEKKIIQRHSATKFI